jgi:hypothetical protein
MKQLVLFLLSFLLLTEISYAIPMMNIRGGGHEKYDFYKTEGWLQTDHSGSGFHLVRDFNRPNIWVRIFKVDTSTTDVIGLPNDLLAGSHAKWDGVIDSDVPALRGGDYFRLIQRVAFSTSVADLDPGSGACTGGGRCYGDWVNNDLLWGVDGEDYQDKDSRSFFEVLEEINGQKRTRYRFTIFVEDNLPFWFKDQNDGYDLSADKTQAILYYPLNRVIVRITESGNFDPSFDDAPSPDYNSYDSSGDEFFMEKKGIDLRVASVPQESRLKNGRLVYNFPVVHAFQKSTDYIIQVVAEDMELNRRVMRFRLNMNPLGGLDIQDRSSGGRKLR